MTEQTIFETNWLKVKRTPRGFDYLERKGKDSVAIFLLRTAANNEIEVLIRYQPLCIDNSEPQTLFPCPITGGIEEGESPFICALREVKEEAGYEIPPGLLQEATKYAVGTQTNEVCFIYFADVSNIQPGVAVQDGSYFEAVSRNQWQPLGFLKEAEYSACQLFYYFIRDRIHLQFEDKIQRSLSRVFQSLDEADAIDTPGIWSKTGRHTKEIVETCMTELRLHQVGLSLENQIDNKGLL